ncbi:ATP-binding cassette domain-containing protein [Anaerobacillus isosaccharinicus]|uniref:ATP-binding cassette domain-containing protein n=1 Tax=Anaerobacillus isosaccharinicus TaxID=1532552 RepID=A0A7S7RC02_9BACI|nr:ATP-binding cassette domain-containing protein [Anaerobacillus isosaccharinicus]MBA5585210.1 ATP-binding cassette domain-containing protein [Anaerobacillus isosaccharinicus]QOY36455.1 ATP-binding cassette domain-containing protein [Anaerobacillus isosaccharinicus]
MKILQLIDVKVIAGKQRLLDIPEFSLEQGDLVGVIGPNGAGKSTLLKVLSFLQAPSEGHVLYKGEEKHANSLELELRRRFAVALQQSLLFDASVNENVGLGLKLRKENKKVIHEKVDYWLKKFNIDHLAIKNARSLSGGEAQRVNLARALILEPEVLFLDEPFSALDFPTKAQLIQDFKEILHDTSTTTFFVSHDLLEIKHLTKSLVVIINGNVNQIGDTKVVIDQPNEAAAPFLNKWKELYTL